VEAPNVRAARRSTGRAFRIGILVAAAVIVGLALVPDLDTDRTLGEEPSAIGAMRAINAAQTAYVERCRGYAPSLPDLVGLIAPDLAQALTVTRSGYVISMEPARTSMVVVNPPEGCRGPVSAYFARADPLPGERMKRHFATDARNVVYEDSTAPIADPIQPSRGTVPVR
jgi:hypothetical protein